jgi:hypothetical protein
MLTTEDLKAVISRRHPLEITALKSSNVMFRAAQFIIYIATSILNCVALTIVVISAMAVWAARALQAMKEKFKTALLARFMLLVSIYYHP